MAVCLASLGSPFGFRHSCFASSLIYFSCLLMRPTALLLKLLIAWLVLAVAACVWEKFVVLWQGTGGLLLLIMLVDAFTLPRRGRITGERSLPGRFALGGRIAGDADGDAFDRTHAGPGVV
jgi:hypothetical protein